MVAVTYHAPTSLDEAVALLSSWAALGRSWWWIRIPIAAFTLALPRLLLDAAFARNDWYLDNWMTEIYLSLAAIVFLSGLAMRFNGYHWTSGWKAAQAEAVASMT